MAYTGKQLDTKLYDVYTKGEVDTAIGNVDLTNLAPNTFTVPNYSSAPSNPSTGDIYYNTTDGVVYSYDGSKWLDMSNKFVASGGTESTYVDGNTTYKVHVFNSSGSFVVTSGKQSVEYLVIGGGGGAGNYGGGGGAGGYRSSVFGELSGGNVSAESTLALATGTYSVSIGAGGAGGTSVSVRGYNGGTTSFGPLSALGGGGGGSNDNTSSYTPGVSGGSGGGGCGQNIATTSGGSGTTGQGFAGGAIISTESSGGASAGGGGAGAVGVSVSGSGRSAGEGNGGAGLPSAITGSTVYRGGGGAGCDGNTNVYCFGGIGGGGDNLENIGAASYGVANTGGGGGGNNSTGASGGSGIVIIRYPI